MAITATTVNDLIQSIDTNIRNKTQRNSITVDDHSDLLNEVVQVLSADTYTNAGSYNSSASTINFTTTNTGVTYSVSGITDTYVTGGTFSSTASTVDFEDNQGGSFYVDLPYKVYTALLTQTGATTPNVAVLENTLGLDLVHVYDSVGSFRVTASTATFTADKTTVSFGSNIDDSVSNFANFVVPNSSGSTTEIYYKVYGDSNTLTDNILSDTMIEIKVYN